MIAIQTANLTKKYGDIIAINGVDLEVEAGEIVGCLGPERSGKTTLLRLLTGLVRPTLGDSTVLATFFCKRESQTAREKRYRYRYGGLYWKHERSGKPADVRFHVWHAQGASPYTCGAAFEEA